MGPNVPRPLRPRAGRGRPVAALIAVVLASAHGAGPLAAQGLAQAHDLRPNVLLIVADDLGVDRIGAYQEHPQPAHTPIVDELAADGLLFRNAWSNPTCSPTRATLLTGRYSFRTGVGRAITYAGGTFELPVTEQSLARSLAPAYATAAAGK